MYADSDTKKIFDLKTSYFEARPFPHCVIDDLWDDSFLKLVEKEVDQCDHRNHQIQKWILEKTQKSVHQKKLTYQ